MKEFKVTMIKNGKDFGSITLFSSSLKECEKGVQRLYPDSQNVRIEEVKENTQPKKRGRKPKNENQQ